MEQSQNLETTWTLWIEGKVQGVGYRRFAQKVALRSGLTGWTRNLADGRVEVCVTTSKRKLELFVAELRKGPMHGEVSDIQVETAPPQKFSDFAILADG